MIDVQDLEIQTQGLLKNQIKDVEMGHKWMDLASKWKQAQRLEKEQLALNQAFLVLKDANGEQAYHQAAKALILLGHSHRAMGHNRQARQAYQASIKHAQDNGEKQNESVAMGFFHLASLAEQTWNLKIASAHYQEARTCFIHLKNKAAVLQLDEKLKSCIDKQSRYKK